MFSINLFKTRNCKFFLTISLLFLLPAACTMDAAGPTLPPVPTIDNHIVPTSFATIATAEVIPITQEILFTPTSIPSSTPKATGTPTLQPSTAPTETQTPYPIYDLLRRGESIWIFSAAEGDQKALYFFEPQTQMVYPFLKQDGVSLVAPSWSNDCRFIAFLRENDQVYKPSIISLDTGNRVDLSTAAAAYGAIAWSDDGGEIAYITGESYTESNLAVVDVSSYEETIIPLETTSRGPDWNSTEQRVLLIRILDPLSNSSRWTHQISILDLATNRYEDLLEPVWGGLSWDNPTRFGYMAATWSPDNSQIAFEVNERPETGLKYPRIYVMNSDGANPRRLTDQNPQRPVTGPLYHEMSPTWSDDGTMIYFTRYFETEIDVWENQFCSVRVDDPTTVECSEPLDYSVGSESYCSQN